MNEQMKPYTPSPEEQEKAEKMLTTKQIEQTRGRVMEFNNEINERLNSLKELRQEMEIWQKNDNFPGGMLAGHFTMRNYDEAIKSLEVAVKDNEEWLETHPVGFLESLYEKFHQKITNKE